MKKPLCRFCKQNHYTYEPHPGFEKIGPATPGLPAGVVADKVGKALGGHPVFTQPWGYINAKAPPSKVASRANTEAENRPKGRKQAKSPQKDVKTKPTVKTKESLTVKTKGSTKALRRNAARQRQWQRTHRDEFNRKRRERYQKRKSP